MTSEQIRRKRKARQLAILSDRTDVFAIRARLGFVAEALELVNAAREVKAAMLSDDGLIRFARRHGQSLDFIIMGDIRPMIRYRPPDAARES